MREYAVGSHGNQARDIGYRVGDWWDAVYISGVVSHWHDGERFRGNVAWVFGSGPVRALVLVAEDGDAEFVVHALTEPARGGGVGVDVDAVRGVRFVDVVPVMVRGRFAVEDVERPPVGAQKAKAAAL